MNHLREMVEQTRKGETFIITNVDKDIINEAKDLI